MSVNAHDGAHHALQRATHDHFARVGLDALDAGSSQCVRSALDGAAAVRCFLLELGLPGGQRRDLRRASFRRTWSVVRRLHGHGHLGLGCHHCLLGHLSLGFIAAHRPVRALGPTGPATNGSAAWTVIGTSDGESRTSESFSQTPGLHRLAGLVPSR